MKNLIIVIIVILIIFVFLSSVRFGFPNSRNPEVTKSWISGSQGYGPNYDLFDEMWSVIVHMIVFGFVNLEQI